MSDYLPLLRDLISEHAGLFTSDFVGLGFLETCLRTRMEQIGCESLEDYHEILSRHDEAAELEFLHLITTLSRPGTAFFRHLIPVNALVNGVIPQLAADGRKALTIWSAGCSTGEEPLAIAIALAQAGWLERLDVRIEGSDGNLGSIAVASSGIVSAKRMRSLEPTLRDKYFTPMGEEWRVNPTLAERMRWSTVNLANESEIAEHAAVDIIVCQNVLIYFSEAKIVRTMRIFADHLRPGGYFLTDQNDHFDSLATRFDGFDRHMFEGLSMWKKPASSAAAND